MKKEEKIKKNKKLKWQVKLILYLIIIILYSFFIGTKGIFIKDYVITSKKITNDMHGTKIIHFSDLHYGSSVNYNDVNKLVKKINQTKPDIVIFTGDLIDENYKLSNNEKKQIIKYLSNIDSVYGKYFINGEEDNENSIEILNNSNFNNIENNDKLIYQKDSSTILLTQKKDKISCNCDNVNYKIILLHNPNDINNVEKNLFDLALAGHTHNGQINIYKIKDFFVKSKYNKPYQKINNTKLFINSGIGTSKIKARLFNHPTINLYRLNKS